MLPGSTFGDISSIFQHPLAVFVRDCTKAQLPVEWGSGLLGGNICRFIGQAILTPPLRGGTPANLWEFSSFLNPGFRGLGFRALFSFTTPGRRQWGTAY